MEVVFGLMVVLLGVSDGIETYCDGRKNGAQCYGALGGTLVLQLMNDATEYHGFNWIKNHSNLLTWRSSNSVIILPDNRLFFTPSNGTLRMNNLKRNDGGEYILSIINKNGEQTAQRTLRLSIQAPVSSVLLDSECLSEGEMRVSCSSEGGDSPQYNWTLDGRTLTDAELLSGNTETNIITLKQHISGHLVCSVRNKVSHVSSSKRLCTCGIETYCDGRQDGAQCYGALGGTLVVQLKDDGAKYNGFNWMKNQLNLLRWRSSNSVIILSDNRFFFTPSDGTLRMNNLRRKDGGDYTLKIYNKKGEQLAQQTLHLFIQCK
ncbi:contactin-4-like [Anabas testudineus]|uniref:contactin-4-like n=1 Tax=Anabas testudineus TaxID=64144 RepID=UPI000E464E36|nr:contactin-4-like [Anabas testudineus]XP_026214030.1 contactin-4-like [Anabas testudineus]